LRDLHQSARRHYRNDRLDDGVVLLIHDDGYELIIEPFSPEPVARERESS